MLDGLWANVKSRDFDVRVRLERAVHEKAGVSHHRETVRRRRRQQGEPDEPHCMTSNGFNTAEKEAADASSASFARCPPPLDR